jgi:hypothetical protein
MDLSSRFNRHNTAPAETGLTYYSGAARVRTVHFALIDGSKLFLSYSELLAGEFAPEENTITLTFTRHVVTLKGRNLSALFDILSIHGVRLITAVNERYAETTDEAQSIVTQIEVRRP